MSRLQKLGGLLIFIGVVIAFYCLLYVVFSFAVYDKPIPPQAEIGQCWQDEWGGEDPFKDPQPVTKVLAVKNGYVLYGWMFSGTMLTNSTKNSTYVAFAKQVSCDEGGFK